MLILDGKKLSDEITLELKSKILDIKEKKETKICLAIIQIGENKASNVYIRNKILKGEQLDVEVKHLKFNSDIEESKIIEKVNELNIDLNITGIILQLPTPDNFNHNLIINKIDPKKDVDGLGDKNLVKLIKNDNSGIVPATALGVLTLLERNNIDVQEKNIAILGRSILVGKPLSLCLLNKNATVTICHSKTADIKNIISNSDIIISATGSHGIIYDDLLTKNQILVDVGISINNGIMVGDANLSQEKIKNLKAISPVPGGVGPMTVISLFSNLIYAYELQN